MKVKELVAFLSSLPDQDKLIVIEDPEYGQDELVIIKDVIGNYSIAPNGYNHGTSTIVFGRE